MQSLDEYKSFLKEVRKATGLTMMVPDETGLLTVSVDGAYTLNLQYIEGTNKILCFIEITKLKEATPKSVYRALLAAALFGKDTAGGYFSLEEESNTLIYNYIFDDKDTHSTDEFIAILEKILQLCEVWVDKINRLSDNQPQSTTTTIDFSNMINLRL